MRVQAQIDSAGFVAAKQHLFPGGPTVFGAVDAARAVWPKGMAESRHVDHIRILWMHAYAPDVARVFQATMPPGLAAVSRFVDAIAVRHVAANGAFPHAHIEHLRVRRRHGNGANRSRVHIAVGDVVPIGAAIGGLPYSPGTGTKIEHHGV